MDYKQFTEASEYAVSTLNPEQIERGWRILDRDRVYDFSHNIILSEIADILSASMDSWCEENGLKPEEWRDSWRVTDVWCNGQAANNEQKGSYASEKYPFSDYSKSEMLQGLAGMLEMMKSYENYRDKALEDIANYYDMNGISVLSYEAGTESSDANDGFTIILDKKSADDFLEKNGCEYNEKDTEETNRRKSSDLIRLTVSGWPVCGENAITLFETLWIPDAYWNTGGENLRKTGSGGINITFNEGDRKTGGSVTIEYSPGVFNTVNSILDYAVSLQNNQNIFKCLRYA